MTANLAKAMTYPLEKQAATDTGKGYRPNLTYAIASLRYRLLGGLLQKISPDQVLGVLHLIAKTQENQRPDRSFHRQKTNPKARRQYK